MQSISKMFDLVDVGTGGHVTEELCPMKVSSEPARSGLVLVVKRAKGGKNAFPAEIEGVN